jgi:uncharacterized protein
VKLTRVERLILSNQYRILEAVDPRGRSEHAANHEIVESGYELHYEDLAEHIRDSVMSREECSEVLAVLSLYDAMQRGYDQLEDRSGIEARQLDFPGFEGADEARQTAYARWYCQDYGRFSQLRWSTDSGRHGPSLGCYREMLRRWEEMGKPLTLSGQQIIAITDRGAA